MNTADAFVSVDIRRFRELSAKLQKLDDRRLVLDFRAGLRKALAPIGAKVLAAMAAASPHRGGLSGIVAGGRVSILADLERGIRLQLSSRGVRMSAVEKGSIRHVVFGNRKAWAITTMEPGVGFRALSEHADEAAQIAMDELAKKVGGAL